MKIIDIDFKENGKKYFCKDVNEVFEIKEGNLIAATRNFSMAELLKLDFEEIKETKNPYKRVEYGTDFYYISALAIHSYKENNHETDNKLSNIANYFNNKAYAEYIAFKETLMRRMDRFAWDHNVKVIDWNDRSIKYYISFNHPDNRLMVDRAFVYMSNNIYFESLEIAEKAIEEFKDDLMKLYTWEFDF